MNILNKGITFRILLSLAFKNMVLTTEHAWLGVQGRKSVDNNAARNAKMNGIPILKNTKIVIFDYWRKKEWYYWKWILFPFKIEGRLSITAAELSI